MSLKSEVDDFHTTARGLLAVQVGQGDSKFSNANLEKALKIRSTFRNINTVVRLAAKYPIT